MLMTDSITKLKGVGAARAKSLNSFGVFTIRQLLEYFPREYEDRSKVTKIKDIEQDERITIIGETVQKAEVLRFNSIVMTKLRVRDDTGLLEAVWFNQPYLKNYFAVGQKYMFTGVVKRGKMESPDYESIGNKELLSSGRIIPMYSVKNGVSQKMLRGLIHLALQEMQNGILDYLPTWIQKEYGLCDRRYAIQNIHFPESADGFFRARKRLVFEEIFIMQLSLFLVKGKQKVDSHIVLRDTDLSKLLDLFSYEMTGAQKRVLMEMLANMTGCYAMNRLVQGDVGSGKTAVAMAVGYLLIQNGYQAALMAPTEVLARQHFASFSQILGTLGFSTELLTGSLTKREKDAALGRIQSGKSQMIIGTHAVIQDKVEFCNLGLVITDEQHRFGVRQRRMLSEKGMNPHILVMTATPIPRTLALILYGDMDISIIDEMPPGRQKIDTYSVTGFYRERIYAFVKKEIQSGRQCYFICSSIEEQEGDIQSVLVYTERLKEIFSEYTVACLHGQMKQDEKQTIMDDFLYNRIQILVSTTVIEVGINVPNSTVMVVENAERFGLAQLHQLRGRVGRGTEKSYCILITDSKNQICRERMQAMTKTNDGFVISELDLKLRGPGEFFGTRQHGLPEMKIANLYKDIDVLQEASKCASRIIEENNGLIQKKNGLLPVEIWDLVEDTISLLSL